MKIEPLEFDIERIMAREAKPRSPGLHLSAIIKDMLISVDGQKYGKEITPEVIRRFELGFLWEEVFGDAMARRYGGGRPHCLLQQEIEKDGIYMTPDCFDTKEWRGEEYKYTMISSAHPLEGNRFWHWRMQGKAYAYGHGCDTWDYYAFHAKGDYKDSGPQVRAWREVYSAGELEDNWRMILNIAKKLRRQNG